MSTIKDVTVKLFISISCVILIKMFNFIYPSASTIHYAILLLVILIIYILVLPIVFNIFYIFIRFERKIFPSIAILNGNIHSSVGEYKCKRHCIHITPVSWYKKLNISLKKSFMRKLNLNIKAISLNEISERYSIIINPFGDNFPEENTRVLKSFYKICDYVNNGGFFICTGGAFYHHQNTKSSIDSKQVIVKMSNNQQSLTDTIFYSELGVLTSGDGSPNEQQKIEVCQKDEDKEYLGDLLFLENQKRIDFVTKFRSTTPQTSNFLPLVREKNGKDYPVVAIPYGKGFFMHFGMGFDSVDSNEFSLVINVLEKLIKKKFKIV